jgi:hypothetical protein
MGQRRNMSEWSRLTEQAIRMPVAWRYLLGDGKRRYRREPSDGTNMRPIYEMTAKDSAALNRIVNNQCACQSWCNNSIHPYLLR